MSIAAIGVAAGAAVISVVALTQAQPAAKPPEAGAVQAGGVKAINGVPVLRDIPVLGTVFVPRSAVTDSTLLSTSAQPAQARFSLTLSGTTLRKAAEAIAQEQGKRLSLRTGSVMDPERSIDSLQLVDVDLCSAVRQLNEALGLIGENRIDFRVRGDAMDVAPIRDFDKAETTLIAYDLSDALRCNAKSEELVETVIQFVEPEGWRENGGETARLKVVGTKMFVEAPPRFHERVAWILDQFSGKATRHANEIRALEAAMKAEAAKVAVDRDRALEKARDEADRVNAHRAAAEAKFKADQADAQRLETIRRQADEAALKATDKSGEPARNSPTQPSDPVAPGGRPGSNVNPGGSPFDAPKLPASTPGAPGGEAPAVPARLPGSSAA